MEHQYSDRQAIIDLRALGRNLKVIKGLAGKAKILAVVKADAYGHGLVPVSRRLVAEGAAALGVGRVEEVEELRRAGLGVPVVILTGVLPWEAELAVRLRSLPMIFDLDTAQALADSAQALGRAAEVLVKIDTGMGRLGFPDQDLGPLAERLSAMGGLSVRGVASHLARADEADKTESASQIRRFNRAVEVFREKGFDLDLNTLANSAGTLDLREAHADLIRPGIILYGAKPGPGIANPTETEPVMTVKTRLIQVREVAAGQPLSYGGTYITPAPARIGVVAMGYGHGLSRSLSSEAGRPKAHLLVRGQKAPIVGRVCMNLTLLDLSGIAEAEVGDEAVVIGTQEDETLRADDLARPWGTIAYEVMCLLGGMNPRTYLDLP